LRILSRYVFKEVVAHSLLGLLVFTFILYIPQLSRLLELTVRRNLPPESLALLFLIPLPSLLVLTLPMAVLVGTLIGLSRMAADGEVIAARALGMGLGQFIRPVMAYAAAGWLLASWMSLVVAPRAALKLARMEAALRSSQASYEIEPRVFIEQFPNLLLYVEDVQRAHSEWRGVFLAATATPDAPKVTLAERGALVNDGASHRLTLHLENGTEHETDPQHPDRYSITSFSVTDIPLPAGQAGEVVTAHSPATLPVAALVRQSLRAPGSDDRRAAFLELNYRLALPAATVVLAWVGIPLGLFSRKGGKSMGVMITVLLVFVYYMLMAGGLSFAKQGKVSPLAGLWLPNLLFAAAGFLIFNHMRGVRVRLQFIQDRLDDAARALEHWVRQRSSLAGNGRAARRRAPGRRFPRILDLYVIRGWAFYFLTLLVAFSGVYMIFDFFQLLGDIVRNHAGAWLVLNYYRFLSPQVLYLMLPLSILVATLVNFSLLAKTNQVTAVKAVGISLYRLSVPVLVLAALVGAGMFLLAEDYLPDTNQRQNALRNEIKGKPPQTYLRPDREWIFGQSSRIYNYRFFDPDHNVFADLSVFEFDPATFAMTRRIYARRAFWEAPIHGWVLEDGWERDLDGSKVTAYRRFAVTSYRELTEPPSYFKKEVKTSEQMSVGELRRYIAELRQSGFDVVQLSVQWYRKFAYPLMALVIVLIAIPFSFSMGRKGALTGVALAIGIAIVYWSSSSLFEAMGNLDQLPPAVAAWSPDLLFGLGGIYLMLRMRT
jgi:LPS export ABC transporter permease LptG/LPS export ABC transporter permease LptF